MIVRLPMERGRVLGSQVLSWTASRGLGTTSTSVSCRKRSSPLPSTLAVKRLCFLGPPGVGKGTYADKVAVLFGIPTISTGHLVRTEIENGSELGKQVKEYNDKGLLVPDEIVVAMVRRLNIQRHSLTFQGCPFVCILICIIR